MESSTIIIPCTYNEYESIGEWTHHFNILSNHIELNQRTEIIDNYSSVITKLIEIQFLKESKDANIKNRHTELTNLKNNIFELLEKTSKKNVFGNVSLNVTVQRNNIDWLTIECLLQEWTTINHRSN